MGQRTPSSRQRRISSISIHSQQESTTSGPGVHSFSQSAKASTHVAIFSIVSPLRKNIKTASAFAHTSAFVAPRRLSAQLPACPSCSHFSKTIDVLPENWTVGTWLAETGLSVGGVCLGAFGEYRDLRKGSREKKLVRLWHGNRVARSLRVAATISRVHFYYFPNLLLEHSRKRHK
jgi:hypothetical protein